jgi:hypothetical protein
MSFRRKSFDAAQDHELVEWPESKVFKGSGPRLSPGDDLDVSANFATRY